jgi:hypothetical protein
MHCEKNLCKNIVRTIIGETYHSRGRKDMEEMGIREELWLRLHRGNLGIFTSRQRRERRFWKLFVDSELLLIMQEAFILMYRMEVYAS